MLNLIKNEHKKIMKKKDHIHCSLLIVVFQLAMALTLKRVISSFGGQDTVANYFAYSTNVVFILQVLAVVIGATLISTEFQKRTIKFLLIRPKTRLHIFLSKYITLVLTVIYLFVFIMFWLFYLVLFSSVLILMKERGNYFSIRLPSLDLSGWK